MHNTRYLISSAVLAVSFLFAGCNSDADTYGVGAQCQTDDDCYQEEPWAQQCLTSFKGGYCGLTGCTTDADCPDASICVAHDDGVNYCFRSCVDKSECNENRDVDVESNCSANITTLDNPDNLKACVPPSG